MEGGKHLALPEHLLHIPPCCLLRNGEDTGADQISRSPLNQETLDELVMLGTLIHPDNGQDGLSGRLAQILCFVSALAEVDVDLIHTAFLQLFLDSLHWFQNLLGPTWKVGNILLFLSTSSTFHLVVFSRMARTLGLFRFHCLRQNSSSLLFACPGPELRNA